MKIPPRTTAGTLQVLELAEIVQLIVHGRKSGRVTIQHGDDEGEIWFDNGAAVHARMANLRGNTAFYHMLTWCTGQFIIEHDLATKERSLDTDTMLLVIDGMRLRDEGAVAAEEPNQDTAPADGSAGVWTALTLTALPAITLMLMTDAPISTIATAPEAS